MRLRSRVRSRRRGNPRLGRGRGGALAGRNPEPLDRGDLVLVEAEALCEHICDRVHVRARVDVEVRLDSFRVQEPRNDQDTGGSSITQQPPPVSRFAKTLGQTKRSTKHVREDTRRPCEVVERPLRGRLRPL